MLDPLARLRALPWEELRTASLAAREGLASVLAGRPAERAVDQTLRRHRSLPAGGRTVVAESIFNVALWRRRLAFHLEAPSPTPEQLLFAFLHLLCDVPAPEAATLSGLDVPPLLRHAPPPTLGLRLSFPDWLVAHFTAELGSEREAEALCRALNVPGPISLRANLLRTSRDALAERLRTEGLATVPGAYSPLALTVTTDRPNLYGLSSLREGLFEVQDEGSQLLGLLVDPRPKETILDLCAGAGGKTLLLGAAMQDRGFLYAFDPDRERLDRLGQRAARAGLSCIRVLRERPGRQLQADRVLVDAPCSELGALRRGPDRRFLLRPEALREHLALQRELLLEAGAHVRPGGRLVYGTCTLHRAENEQAVAGFLAERTDFRLLPAGEPWLPPACRRGDFLSCAPHLHGTDGFFGAVMLRA